MGCVHVSGSEARASRHAAASQLADELTAAAAERLGAGVVVGVPAWDERRRRWTVVLVRACETPTLHVQRFDLRHAAAQLDFTRGAPRFAEHRCDGRRR